MSSYISEELRRQVYERANKRCEYCLISEAIAARPHEADHIYAEKHKGATVALNLCLSCYYCNRHKGRDLCSLDDLTGELTRLFNPRLDKWSDHFNFSTAEISGKTAIGRVTSALLQLNAPERLAERRIAIRLGDYGNLSN